MQEQRHFKYLFDPDELSVFESKCRLTAYRMNSYKRLSKILSGAIQAELDWSNTQFDSHISKAQTDEESIYIQELAEMERKHLLEYLAGIQLSALFISVIASIEISMTEICLLYKDKFSSTETLRKHYRGVNGKKKYIKKVTGIDLPKRLKNEDTVTDFFEIRNKLVHASMNWEELPQDTMRLVQERVPNAVKESKSRRNPHLLVIMDGAVDLALQTAIASGTTFLTDFYQWCRKSCDMQIKIV